MTRGRSPRRSWHRRSTRIRRRSATRGPRRVPATPTRNESPWSSSGSAARLERDLHVFAEAHRESLAVDSGSAELRYVDADANVRRPVEAERGDRSLMDGSQYAGGLHRSVWPRVPLAADGHGDPVADVVVDTRQRLV